MARRKKRKTTEINSIVIDNYDRYSKIKTAKKRMPHEVISFSQSATHRKERVGDADVCFDELAETCRLNVALNVERTKTFRFRLFCQALMDLPCYRFESDGSCHENPSSPDCPLPKRSVPTPHFHRYDEKGQNIAYRTEDLDSAEAAILNDVNKAFALFCKEENIELQGKPELVREQSLFGTNTFADPLEGVTFP